MTCQFASSECRPPLEWHHVIKQQRLRREFKYGAYRVARDRWWPLDRYMQHPTPVGDVQVRDVKDILGDTRNRVFLCSHHHEQVTNGRLKVELPDSVWEFAREFGLEGMLENDLRRAA